MPVENQNNGECGLSIRGSIILCFLSELIANGALINGFYALSGQVMLSNLVDVILEKFGDNYVPKIALTRASLCLKLTSNLSAI